jgi:hypothetical protein
VSLANGVAVPLRPDHQHGLFVLRQVRKDEILITLDGPTQKILGLSTRLFLLDILPGREDNSFTSRLRRAVPTEGEGSAAPREAMDIQWSSGIQIPLSLEFQFPSSLPVTLFAGVVI